jgi:surfactin synthase thioesterase subunit
VCVPWAGAGAAAFREWAFWLAARAEVRAVRLPGRESRFAEPPPTDLDEAVAECVAAVSVQVPADRDVVLFGHCSGAVLAYEIARAWPAADRPPPRGLVVASQDAPHLPRDLEGWRDAVQELLDTVSAGVADPLVREELLEVVRPAIEADVRLFRGYRHRAGPPLDVPVTVLVSAEDARRGWLDPGEWARHSTAGTTFRVIEGDHLFTGASWRTLAAAVADTLPG